MGDVPIYVALDSADVWAHPEQFQLDDDLRPREVAGCPARRLLGHRPALGQPPLRLGPHEGGRLRAGGCSRVAFQLRLYDILRIDHFRGFDSYFAIPAGAVTAAERALAQGAGHRAASACCEDKARTRAGSWPRTLGYLTDCGAPAPRRLRLPRHAASSSSPSTRATARAPSTCRSPTPQTPLPTSGPTTTTPRSAGSRRRPSADARLAREYLHLDAAEGEGWGMMRGIWAQRRRPRRGADAGPSRPRERGAPQHALHARRRQLVLARAAGLRERGARRAGAPPARDLPQAAQRRGVRAPPVLSVRRSDMDLEKQPRRDARRHGNRPRPGEPRPESLCALLRVTRDAELSMAPAPGRAQALLLLGRVPRGAPAAREPREPRPRGRGGARPRCARHVAR